MAKSYLIGNAHLDPVWLWKFQEGFSEILSTYRSALDRMKEFPDYKFTSACASYYRWVEKIDLEMFEEIKQRVKEGRWNVVGGWHIQPDCNIPSGESFARHALISQRYLKEKFGVIAKTGYNVDSFGHNANLPKILKASGMENYTFTRPEMHEKPELEHYLFNWEADDGSKVCAYRIPWGYCLTSVEQIGDANNKTKEDNKDYMIFYGVGNHGGGPTIALLEELEKLRNEKFDYSTPDEYFVGVEKEKLPVVKDELQHHARGCYSASSLTKAFNRKCENNLITAEKMAVLAEKLTGFEYPYKRLEKAWKNVLFNQFHDIMGGCSIKSAYDDAHYLYGETMSITEQIINDSMQKITANIDTLRGLPLPAPGLVEEDCTSLGIPIVIFNPNMHKVKSVVKIRPAVVKLTDEQGNEVPFQIVRAEQTNRNHNTKSSAFTAEIEPLGYRVYRMFMGELSEVKTYESSLKVTEYSLENDKIKVVFDKKTGDICEFYNKETKDHIIQAPCKAVLLDETNADTWSHGVVYLGEYTGEFLAEEFKIIEKGPVRGVLRIKTKYNNSIIVRDFSICENSEVINVKTKIDFHEEHRVLKFSFPTKGENVMSEIPYGTFTRPLNTGEEFCHSWVSCGKLCVATDSKYAYDTTDDNLRITVLRSPIYADHYAATTDDRDDLVEYMEQGIQEFNYSIFPFVSKSDSVKKAQELNVPLRVLQTSFHKGNLPENKGAFSCDNNNVIITALKNNEDKNGFAIRFYECEGDDTSVKISLFDREIETNLKHNQVKTILENGKEVNFLEW